MKYIANFFFIVIAAQLFAQEPGYWQQAIEYKMDIDFDVQTHRFTGKQTIEYTNNSSETLTKVYYHLYYNAFQPGSMMDVRSRTIKDPDGRVRDRIAYLKEDEIGYHKIDKLQQNGKTVKFEIEGTILVVYLIQPIKPGGKSKFYMEFNSQVPVQIRRTGRHNQERIDYSMTQWYPKMCEFDEDGWHTNPYVGREFHGVWGDFDVTITMDKDYVIGGTGYLQNPDEIGHGYSSKKVKAPKNGKLSWHFKAPQVHDFAWAADPDFKHDQQKLSNGTVIHFFYQTDTLAENWIKVQPLTVKAFEFANKTFGEYPYKQYSILQGGDGGMEYPMATLVTSHGSFGGLLSVIIHEAMHSWYQGVLGTNESKYAWMDEGFTSFGQNVVKDHVNGKKQVNPHTGAYRGYYHLAPKDYAEPLTTHADHYNLNSTHGINVYSKGCVFLHQLGYVIGEETLFKGLRQYFEEWKFKHPNPRRFKRVMEKVSGIELDWYFENWVGTIKTIDYAIEKVEANGSGSRVVLRRIGQMPMPLDIYVTTMSGEIKVYNIPMVIMRGTKEGVDLFKGEMAVAKDWPWTYTLYELPIDMPFGQIQKIEIDASGRLADIDSSNDVWRAGNKRTSGDPVFGR